MTAAEIAEVLGMALSTVSRWLRRIGLGKRSRLAAARAAQPLRAQRPGELDPRRRQEARADPGSGHRVTGNRRQHARRTRVGNAGRKLGTAGWEFVHVCVDDATRLAYVEVLPDERGETAAGFLRRAVAWFASLGIEIEAVMSDNGSCYAPAPTPPPARSLACGTSSPGHTGRGPTARPSASSRHLTDRWAYGAVFGTSAERTRALPGWLAHYNFRRRHGSLGHRPPGSRLAELQEQPG